jgi:hypothetical protein
MQPVTHIYALIMTLSNIKTIVKSKLPERRDACSGSRAYNLVLHDIQDCVTIIRPLSAVMLPGPIASEKTFRFVVASNPESGSSNCIVVLLS